MTREQYLISRKNQRKARKYFESIGELPPDREPREYIMHHKNPEWKHTDVERYILWNPDDLVVIKATEHNTIHHKDAHFKMPKDIHKGEKNPFYQKHHTDEARTRMSAAKKNRALTTDWKTNIGLGLCKKVRCIETGEVFNSSLEAQEWCGSTHVGDVCHGRRNIAGGYHWEYL